MKPQIAAALLALATCCTPEAEPARSAPPAKRAETRSTPASRTGDSEHKPAAEADPESTAPASDSKPMLIDFTRDHCLPCNLMAPWLEEVRRSHGGSVEIAEINIDRPENREIGAHFKVKSIPTQVYVDSGGREVLRHVGLATRPQMVSTMRKLGFIR